MNLPVPRRRQPWGAVLASAPWDGRAVTPEPVRMPATAAAPLAGDRPRSPRRAAFGALLTAAPWSGRSTSADAHDGAEEDTTLETFV